MRVFANLNETGPAGWMAFRTLLLASDKLVIWAPSASYLDAADGLQDDYAGHPAIPSRQELLGYVRAGQVQIMGRQWWFNDPDRRNNHPWVHAQWLEGFDDELASIAQEDGRKPAEERRVKFSFPEDGLATATNLVQSGQIKPKDVLDRIDLNSTPEGIREKLVTSRNDEDRAISILRDLHNFFAAKTEAGVENVFGLPVYYNIMLGLADAMLQDNTESGSKESEPLTDVSRIVEPLNRAILRVVASGDSPAVSKAQVAERVQRLLGAKDDLKDLRADIAIMETALATMPDADEAVRTFVNNTISSIDKGLVHRKWTDMLPGTPIEQATLLGSLSLIAVDAYLQTGTWSLGLGLLSLQTGRPLLARMGAVPEVYKGPRWPFYLAQGHRHVNAKFREGFIARLRND